jgi:ADP-heptose:LPS heptosyltransferase
MLTNAPALHLPTLFIAPCDLSHALLTQPALSLWRLKNREQPVVVVAKKTVAAVYSAMPEVAEVVIAPEQIFGHDGLLTFLERLQKQRFKSSYLLCNRLGARTLTTLLKIDNRHAFKAMASGSELVGRRSEDYAALMLNLSSTAELPIHLPVPSLRADGHSQRALLKQCGIDAELYGTAGQIAKLRPSVAIFVIEIGRDPQWPTLLQEILDLFFQRWPNAYIAILDGCNVALHTSTTCSARSPLNTIELTTTGKLALVSMAAGIITDKPELIQISDAFCSPVVCLNDPASEGSKPSNTRWPSHQGRYSISAVNSEEILQNMEKVLRFDRQYQRLSKTD